MALRLMPPSTKPPARILPSGLEPWLSEYCQVESIVWLFVWAQMLSSALQNEPLPFDASRCSAPFSHSYMLTAESPPPPVNSANTNRSPSSCWPVNLFVAGSRSGQPAPPVRAPPFWRNQKPMFVVPPVGSYLSPPK